jgi:hypothetical protein
MGRSAPCSWSFLSARSVVASPNGATSWGRSIGRAIAGAQCGLDALIEQMPRFLEHARALGAALDEVPGIVVVPSPPQSPLFHLHLRGDPVLLRERALEVARQRRVWLFHRLEPSVVPNVNKLELNVGEPALDITPGKAAELFAIVTGT